MPISYKEFLRETASPSQRVEQTVNPVGQVPAGVSANTPAVTGLVPEQLRNHPLTPALQNLNVDLTRLLQGPPEGFGQALTDSQALFPQSTSSSTVPDSAGLSPPISYNEFLRQADAQEKRKRGILDIRASDFPTAFKMFGNDLRRSVIKGNAEIYELGANAFKLVDNVTDFLDQGGASDPAIRTGVLRSGEDFLRDLGQKALNDAKKIKGTSAATFFNELLGSLPSTLAQYLAGVKLLGPIMGFASVDALKAYDEGLAEAAIAGTKGAATGLAAQVSAPFTRFGKGVTLGTTAGAAEAIDPRSTNEDILTTSFLMAGVGAAFGGRGAGVTLREATLEGLEDLGERAAERIARREARRFGEGVETATRSASQTVDPRLDTLLKREFLPKRRVREAPTQGDINVAMKMIKDTEAGRPSKPLPHKPGDPERGQSLNLDKIFKGKEGLRVARETERYFPTEIQLERYHNEVFARMGRIPVAASQLMAQKLGMPLELFEKRMLKTRRGEPFNHVEMLTGSYALQNAGFRAQRKLEKAIGGGDAEIADFINDFTRYRLLHAQYSGNVSEVARTLNIIRRLDHTARNPTLEGFSKFIDEMGGRPGVQGLANMIRGMTPEQMARFATHMQSAKLSDKILWAWYNALLSGPQTHAINLVGSAMFTGQMVAERAVAAGVGATRSGISQLQGKGPVKDRVYFREVSSGFANLMENIRTAMEIGRRAFRTGELADPTTKLEARAPDAAFGAESANAVARFFGRTANIPTRALSAEDEFIKSVARQWETQALAKRQAIMDAKGKKFETPQLENAFIADRYQKLVADPPPELSTRAIEFGRSATFTNHLGATRHLQQFVNELPALKVILPFIRTPVNLQKEAWQRTPLISSLSSEVREAFNAGGASRDNVIAKNIMGGTFMAGTGYLALQGIITGAGTGDPQTRALERIDVQPYSVRFNTSEGPRFISISRLDPLLGTQVAVAADLVQLHDEVSKEDRQKVGMLLSMSISNNMLSKTYLKGLSDFMLAMTDGTRYADSYVQGITTSIVPNILSQVSRTIDPALLEANSILDKARIKAGFPAFGIDKLFGLEPLNPKLDRFGQPRVGDQFQLGEPLPEGHPLQRVQQSGEFFLNLFSPTKLKRSSNDPIAKMLLDAGQILTKAPKKVLGIELDDDQHHRYQQLIGQLSYAALENLRREVPEFDQIPKVGRHKRIEEVKQAARSVAQRVMTTEFDNILIDKKEEIEETRKAFEEMQNILRR